MVSERRDQGASINVLIVKQAAAHGRGYTASADSLEHGAALARRSDPGDRLERFRDISTAFLATMSHEIRTPMNGVIGMAEVAVAAGDTQQVGAVAHKLKSSSRSVGALAFGDLCAGLESAGKVGDKAASTQDMPNFEAALAAVEAEIAGLLEDSDGDIRIRAHGNTAHR